jgi:hypothetical protein
MSDEVVLEPKDILSLSASFLLAIAAGYGAYLARVAIRSQSHALKWRANHDFHSAAWGLLASKPNMLELHGIDPAKLEQDGILRDELIYIYLHFDAGSALYDIGDDKRVELTPFRKYFLSNSKVRMVWTKYLRERFFNPDAYSTAIDAHIKMLDNECLTQQQGRNVR